MKFFDEYDALKGIMLTDLPTPGYEPFLKRGGVLGLERPGNILRIITYAPDDPVHDRIEQWFVQTHRLLKLPEPNLARHTNVNSQVIGIDGSYDSSEERRGVEDFILRPFHLMLNFPYIKRFHLQCLALSGGRVFAPDETRVRLVVSNTALAFCLMVNHEGHDYRLTHPHHKEWGRALMDDFGIEGYSIEQDADFYLASEEDFERIYGFLTINAVSSSYH